MGVAGGDRGDAEPFGELGEPAVARAVVPAERPLQLDPEALGPERAQQALGPVQRQRRQRGGGAPAMALEDSRHGPLACAAGEADEALAVPLEAFERQHRRHGISRRSLAGIGVGLRQQAAEVAPTFVGLDEQRQVEALRTEAGGHGSCHLITPTGVLSRRSRLAGVRRGPPIMCHPWVGVGDRYLGAGDWPDAEGLGGLGELHCAPDSVVVGDREGFVALVGCRLGQLVGMGGAVEE